MRRSIARVARWTRRVVPSDQEGPGPARAASRPDFLVLTAGRSGSTHLCGLLDSHPDIACAEELLGRPEIDDIWAHLAGCLIGPEPVRGFKLPVDSWIKHPDSLELLRDPSLRIVISVRSNMLARFISLKQAQSSGVWHSVQGSAERSQLTIDASEAMGWFRSMLMWERLFDELSLGHPTLRVPYERLNDPTMHRALTDFLGVRPAPLASDHEKLRTLSQADTITNHAEVQAALRGTRFEAYLDDEVLVGVAARMPSTPTGWSGDEAASG